MSMDISVFHSYGFLISEESASIILSIYFQSGKQRNQSYMTDFRMQMPSLIW